MNLEDLSPLESAMKRITGFLPGASLASYAAPISYAAQANQPAAMSATPGAVQPVTPASVAAPVAPVTAPAAAPVAAPASVASAWQSPRDIAAAKSPGRTSGMSVNQYIASKLGGYDWRGKASQVGMLGDEYRGGPMSSANAYIASKLGGYDWRGKTSQVGRLSDEYRQLMKNPNQR